MMIDPARFQALLNGFQLVPLFNEFGWDRPSTRPQPVHIEPDTFTLSPVAQKRGVVIFLCSPDATGGIPVRAVQLKIEKEATKLAHEHLLIFTDAAQMQQTWLWVSRTPGAPAATRTHTWHKGSSGEALRQKLEHIAFSLDEEEALTLVGVTVRLRDAFDRDKVTKRFYEHFSREHKAFAGFIQGIAATAPREWYASLMLNRLMFVYFIQRKGFLDGNIHYLGERLKSVQKEVGKGKFHTFYRLFLCRLFHEGLGQPKAVRDKDLNALLGDVPYLNGGLFAVHELEETHPNIDIPDEAFEKLFAFFDAYDWHLDDRPLSKGSEINPDVLGYIFEKYINQKQMGAYYTKEDITEYIAKNTVLPFLLERAKERCKVAFEGEASVWRLLADDPDRYLYPAMKRGVIDRAGQIVPEDSLPDFVQTGMKDPKARMFDRRYNLGEASLVTATGEPGTLPTETWREYVERRNRCLNLRETMQSGQIHEIDDLVTHNLNIRQFVQDVIDTCTGPDLLRALWQTIVGRVPDKANQKFRHGISILDPTCGSGAFLFAALNVLEPLYEACLERMESFVQDASKLPLPSGEGGGEGALLPSPRGRGAGGEGAFPDFRKVLEEVSHHSSRRYFIYKSIILHNLFGVDLMAEAVEICKLRLFLKLVSQVDAGTALEPLPDIDFNIRSGNTLVGYATESQFDTIFHSTGLGQIQFGEQQDHKTEIKARIADLSEAFDRFREQQIVHDGKVTAEDKRGLKTRLAELADELDRYLAREYGIDPAKKKAYADWKASHQPFHWFAEFHGIMADGGFDVVIGNPPYVELRDIETKYKIHGFKTHECGNLYALCSEKALQIVHSISGKFGFIIPVASTCTDGYSTLKFEILSHGRCFISSYNDRPGRLFDGLEHIRLSIVIVHIGKSGAFTTKYNKWNTVARESLFPILQYQQNNSLNNWIGSVPKIGMQIEQKILTTIYKSAVTIGALIHSRQKYPIYYTRKLSGFVQILNFVPSIEDEYGQQRPPSELKEINFSSAEYSGVALALLNSSIFYWFLTIYSDVRNLNKREVHGFPLLKLTAFSISISYL